MLYHRMGARTRVAECSHMHACTEERSLLRGRQLYALACHMSDIERCLLMAPCARRPITAAREPSETSRRAPPHTASHTPWAGIESQNTFPCEFSSRTSSHVLHATARHGFRQKTATSYFDLDSPLATYSARTQAGPGRRRAEDAAQSARRSRCPARPPCWSAPCCVCRGSGGAGRRRRAVPCAREARRAAQS